MRSHPFASSDALRARLAKMAEERGVSVSRLIREGLYEAFPELADLKDEEEDEVAGITAVGMVLYACAALLALILALILVR